MYNEQVPDFIINLGSRSADATDPVLNNTSSEQVPDFIRSLNETKLEQNRIQREINLKDREVETELGVQLDKDWASDESEVKSYVDSLSDDDYDTWYNLREQGYSLEARKALMENQDLLYDINEIGNKKFYSGNQSSVRNALMNLVQDSNLLYEDTIHPWSISAQDWLNERAANLDEKYSRENIYGKNIERIDPYNNTENNLIKQGQIYATSVVSNLKREGIVLAKMGIQLASLGVNFFDNLINLNLQAQANLVNPSQEKIDKYGYEPVVIDPNKRATTLGSYLQMVEDVFGVGFVTAYPVASFILTELADSSPTADSLLSLVNGGFEKVAEKMMDIGFIDKRADNNLSEADKEYLKRDIAQGLFIVTTAIMGWGGKKFSQTEMYKNWETSLRVANEFGKRGANESLQRGKAIRDIIGEQPTGTELLNNKGKPIAVSTENGGQLTPRGSLNVLLDAAGSYGKSFKEALNWRWRDKNKRLVTRDPNAPVGELPGVPMVDEKTTVEEAPVEEKPTEEIKPKEEEIKSTEEVKIEDLKEVPKPNLKKAVPKGETSKGTIGEGISSFIKRVTNSLAGTEGGLSQELITKLQNSPDLQNEYVNTIDPYLRSNGASNPAGVIKDQLADFVQTAKDQLDLRRGRNQDFRSGQMKYRTEIPEYEREQRKAEDLEIKNLIKILSKSQDNPEQFLKYLLNLPKEKVQNLEKYIPDFSKNLGIIQDTLEITKAITKPDLVDKFLSFKSERRLRNKGFLKKLFYSYLKEKYREQGLKANMRELETLINKLSEEELKQRAEAMQTEDGEFPEAVNRSIAQITDFEGPRAGKPYKKFLEQGHENLIPKSAIFDELAYEGYRSVGSRDEFGTDRLLADINKGNLSDILHTKYSDGTTPLDWIDFYNIGLRGVGFLPKDVGAQHLVNGIIEFRENLDSFNAWVLAHEIVHEGLGHLTTKELFDFYNGIVKSTKSLRKYEGDSERDKDMKAISEYMSLERTRVGVEDYVADSLAQILYKGDLYELDDFLPPGIWSLDLTEKVNNIFSQIAKDLWDNLSAFETENGKYSTQAEELKKMLDKIRPNKENKQMSKRRYLEWSPMAHTSKGGISKVKLDHRLSKLQDVNPELSNLKFDLDLKSDRLGSLVFEMEDGRQLNWDEFKNTLSEEQLKKFNSDPVMGQEEWESSLKEEEQIVQNSMANISPKFSKYSKALNKIDPDILGLVEKDGHIYVKYLIESQRERYELPDRPGYVEVKEVPAKDYFTEEELNKLPKDLQKIIKKDAD